MPTTKDAPHSGLRLVIRLIAPVHRLLYRASGGRWGRDWANGGMPVLLLTTTGRKTGRPRTWPVGYLTDGEDVIIVGSYGGLPQPPAWYLNLRANPRVTMQIGASERPMLATTAIGDQRVRLWSRVIAEYPFFATYQQGVTRELPVVILSPLPGEA